MSRNPLHKFLRPAKPPKWKAPQLKAKEQYDHTSPAPHAYDLKLCLQWCEAEGI